MHRGGVSEDRGSMGVLPPNGGECIGDRTARGMYLINRPINRYIPRVTLETLLIVENILTIPTILSKEAQMVLLVPVCMGLTTAGCLLWAYIISEECSERSNEVIRWSLQLG